MARYGSMTAIEALVCSRAANVSGIFLTGEYQCSASLIFADQLGNTFEDEEQKQGMTVWLPRIRRSVW
jgi:hypothetical protein